MLFFLIENLICIFKNKKKIVVSLFLNSAAYFSEKDCPIILKQTRMEKSKPEITKIIGMDCEYVGIGFEGFFLYSFLI